MKPPTNPFILERKLTENHQKISESEEIAGLSVTVIYDQHKDRVEGAADFCQEKGWNYKDWEDMQGCEDECIIVMAVCPPKNSFTNLNLILQKAARSLSVRDRGRLYQRRSLRLSSVPTWKANFLLTQNMWRRIDIGTNTMDCRLYSYR